MRTGGIFLLVYILIGVAVAIARGYVSGLNTIPEILELLVAVLIWPLVLFGVDINFSGPRN
jgi:hypothetical protein